MRKLFLFGSISLVFLMLVLVGCKNTEDKEFLSPQTGTGSVYISSNPLGASIIYNGVERGVTPKTFSNLAVGDYTFALKKKGYKEATQTVTVTSDNPYRIVSLTLVAINPCDDGRMPCVDVCCSADQKCVKDVCINACYWDTYQEFIPYGSISNRDSRALCFKGQLYQCWIWPCNVHESCNGFYTSDFGETIGSWTCAHSGQTGAWLPAK